MSMNENRWLGVARIISETNQNYRIETKMPPSNNFAMIVNLAERQFVSCQNRKLSILN